MGRVQQRQNRLRAGAGIFTGQIDNQITNVTNVRHQVPIHLTFNIVVSAVTLPGAYGAAFIYRTLLAQCVIVNAPIASCPNGGRQIVASDLTQFGLQTGPGRPLEARIRIGENYQNPETYQVSGALQQDLGGGLRQISAICFHAELVSFVRWTCENTEQPESARLPDSRL